VCPEQREKKGVGEPTNGLPGRKKTSKSICGWSRRGGGERNTCAHFHKPANQKGGGGGLGPHKRMWDQTTNYPTPREQHLGGKSQKDREKKKKLNEGEKRLRQKHLPLANFVQPRGLRGKTIVEYIFLKNNRTQGDGGVREQSGKKRSSGEGKKRKNKTPYPHGTKCFVNRQKKKKKKTGAGRFSRKNKKGISWGGGGLHTNHETGNRRSRKNETKQGEW